MSGERRLVICPVNALQQVCPETCVSKMLAKKKPPESFSVSGDFSFKNW